MHSIAIQRTPINETTAANQNKSRPMGTRHLIAVFVDGTHRVAQYGQWDGYPTGQGVEILRFLRNVRLKDFADKVRQARFIGEEELKNLWTTAGADPGSDFVGMDVSERFKTGNPQLSRDAGAEVLQHIMDAKEPGLPLKDSIDFAGDSLMCEWAYVIDLDKNTFEVFQGFNEEPLKDGERFKDAPKRDCQGNYDYYPVRFVKKWSLFDLPEEDDFIASVEPEQQEA